MIAAIILAAGSSTRFGGPKQLAEVGDETLVERTVRISRAAGLVPIVVLGARWEEVERSLPESVERIRNPQWADGMGTSIATGVAAAVENGADSVVIVPCDLPALGAADLVDLVEARGEADVSAARFDGLVGAPACFGRRCFDALLGLEGDVGARHLLRSGRWEVVGVEMPSAGRDVDTVEELNRHRED